MRSAFWQILHIKNVDYTLPLLKSLSNIIPDIFPDGLREDQRNSIKLSKSLRISWQDYKVCSWRHLIEFIKAIPIVNIELFDDELYEYFLDEFILLVKTGNYQVKSEAARGCCRLLRLPSIYKKSDFFLRNISILKNSASYYERLEFLEFGKAMTEYYSDYFIKSRNVVYKMLELANDKISTMRIRLIKILIDISPRLKEDLQVTIEETLKILANDSNSDVKLEAEKSISMLPSIIEESKLKKKEFMKNDMKKESIENDLIDMVNYY